MNTDEQADRRSVSGYRQYARSLRTLIQSVVDDGLERHRDSVASALNGQAATELRRLVSLDLRRDLGAFFTTSDLRRKALQPPPGQDDAVVYFDPACGAGDLLVEAALRLPASDGFEATVHDWGERLLGCDLAAEFVETARLRLLLAAAYRSGGAIASQIERNPFPRIVVGDGLSHPGLASRANHIVVNPPFGYVKAPDDLRWASGRVSAAAVFFVRLTDLAPMGASITAILPDVLRSGTRYAKWRALVETKISISQVELHGGFDRSTDVDVFLLRGTRSCDPSGDTEWRRVLDKGATVDDRFDIHVGPVVPHRDPHAGPWHPYVWPRRLPTSGSFDPAGRSRRFAGRTFDPPFVAIRRTSRPEQAGRASGVVVVGDRPVAVENHLIVALPKDGAASSCVELVKVLDSQDSRDWLNQRIRTRHLTVVAISELPWPGRTSDG